MLISPFKADYKLLASVKVRSEGYKEYAFLSAGPFDLSTSVGTEILFNKLVFVRGGLENDQLWSLGGGIVTNGINLDYAFKPDYEDLGNTHKISVSYNWSGALWKQGE